MSVGTVQPSACRCGCTTPTGVSLAPPIRPYRPWLCTNPRPIAIARRPRSHHNTRDHARRNISEHYDLSNELFAEYLDQTMAYSSALFDQLPTRSTDMAEAQRRKIGSGENPRYEALLGGDFSVAHVLGKIFAIQAAATWFVSLHPDYFGDASVWWGLWLVSTAGWISLATVLSPVVMTYFRVCAPGARLTEKHLADRPGLSEYASRTFLFIPRPPLVRTG